MAGVRRAGLPAVRPRARAFVTGLSRRIEAPIFTGTNDADTLPGRSGADPGDFRVYNAAYLVSGDSILPGRYAKRRLVPVAERVPFLPGLLSGFFEKLSDWTGQFAPGRAGRHGRSKAEGSGC